MADLFAGGHLRFTNGAWRDDNGDAVEIAKIVRCKDCKYRGDDAQCPMMFEETIEIDEGDGCWDTDYVLHDRTKDDSFCSYGERRTDAWRRTIT